MSLKQHLDMYILILMWFKCIPILFLNKYYHFNLLADITPLLTDLDYFKHSPYRNVR